MNHYLRNTDNETVVDAQTDSKKDFSVVVCIDTFGPMLLNVERGMAAIHMINEFTRVQELRGVYFEGGDVKRMTADEFLEVELKKTAAKYGLTYVTD